VRYTDEEKNIDTKTWRNHKTAICSKLGREGGRIIMKCKEKKGEKRVQ
jgi:hypothetical protein